MTQHETMKLWCMVPLSIREERIKRVNAQNKDYNEKMEFHSQSIELPEDALMTILLSVLELQLNPINFLKEKWGRQIDNCHFDQFVENPELVLNTIERRSECIWVLNKFFRDCGRNAGGFLVSLDPLYTNRFFGSRNMNPPTTTSFFVELIIIPRNNTAFISLFCNMASSDDKYDIQSRILSGMTLRDISALASVNKCCRSGVWLHLFKCAPTRYEVPKTAIFAWLCVIKRLGLRLSPDMRKKITKMAESPPGDVRIYWD